MKKKNKKNEIVLRLKIPNIKVIFMGTLILLGLYFLTYFVVNSYAQSNGLKEKELYNPAKWFVREENETIIWYPTISLPDDTPPTATPKPKVQAKNINTNTNQNGQIDCIGPDGKHFNTTQAECDKFNQAWGSNKNNSSTNNQKNTSNTGSMVRCSSTISTASYDFGTISYDECVRKMKEYYDNKKIAFPTLSLPIVSNPTPTTIPSISESDKQKQIIDQHNSEVMQCRQYVTERVADPLFLYCLKYARNSPEDSACQSDARNKISIARTNCGELY